jgi:hypothetical protein
MAVTTAVSLQFSSTAPPSTPSPPPARSTGKIRIFPPWPFWSLARPAGSVGHTHTMHPCHAMRRRVALALVACLLCRLRPPHPNRGCGHPRVDAACHVGDATDASGADPRISLPIRLDAAAFGRWSPIPKSQSHAAAPQRRDGFASQPRCSCSLAFPAACLTLALTALRLRVVSSSWPACTCVPSACSVSHAGRPLCVLGRPRRRRTNPPAMPKSYQILFMSRFCVISAADYTMIALPGGMPATLLLLRVRFCPVHVAVWRPIPCFGQEFIKPTPTSAIVLLFVSHF